MEWYHVWWPCWLSLNASRGLSAIAEFLVVLVTIPMCYHVKLGSSVSKGVRINRREPHNWERLVPPPEWGRDWPPINTPLPHTCYPAEYGRSGSNGTSLIKEILLKNLTTRFLPFKVMGTDTHRFAIRLPIYVPQPPLAYLVPFLR